MFCPMNLQGMSEVIVNHDNDRSAILSYPLGPEHWGREAIMFSEDVWPACSKGKQQSPINIKLKDLVYDHTLKPLVFEGVTSEVCAYFFAKYIFPINN